MCVIHRSPRLAPCFHMKYDIALMTKNPPLMLYSTMYAPFSMYPAPA